MPSRLASHKLTQCHISSLPLPLFHHHHHNLQHTWKRPVNGVQKGSGTREGWGDCSAARVAALGCVRPALGGVAHPTMRSNSGEASRPITLVCAGGRLGVVVALPGGGRPPPPPAAPPPSRLRTAGGGDMNTAAATAAAAAAILLSGPLSPVRLLALLGRPPPPAAAAPSPPCS